MTQTDAHVDPPTEEELTELNYILTEYGFPHEGLTNRQDEVMIFSVGKLLEEIRENDLAARAMQAATAGGAGQCGWCQHGWPVFKSGDVTMHSVPEPMCQVPCEGEPCPDPVAYDTGSCCGGKCYSPSTPALPRLTEAMIRAACKAHYGDDNIDGHSTTAYGFDWSFRQAFRHMWRGARAALEPATATAQEGAAEAVAERCEELALIIGARLVRDPEKMARYSAASPTPAPEPGSVEGLVAGLRVHITALGVGCCSCGVKTFQVEYHDANCKARNVAEALDNVDDLADAITTLQQQLAAKDARIAAMQGQLDRERHAADEYEARATAAEAECAKLREELAQLDHLGGLGYLEHNIIRNALAAKSAGGGE